MDAIEGRGVQGQNQRFCYSLSKHKTLLLKLLFTHAMVRHVSIQQQVPIL